MIFLLMHLIQNICSEDTLVFCDGAVALIKRFLIQRPNVDQTQFISNRRLKKINYGTTAVFISCMNSSYGGADYTQST